MAAEFIGTIVFLVAYFVAACGWCRASVILSYVRQSLKREREFRCKLLHGVVDRVTVAKRGDVVILYCDDAEHACEVFDLLSEELVSQPGGLSETGTEK